MRAIVLAAVLASLAFAGCIQGGEPIDTTSVEPADDSDPSARSPAANETHEPTATNGTGASPDANRTEPANASETTDANGTGDASPEPARLPGNLSMAGAEVIERTDQQVRFRWQGAIGRDTAEAGLQARTSFDVPSGIPLAINATMRWSNASDLDLAVDGDGVAHYCSSTTPADRGLEGGTEACSVRTFARSAWDTWGVRVDGSKLGQDAPPRPANFTIELAIEVAEPWTGPPVEAPGPAAGATSDPGWPAIADAAIRPGVKVGTAASGVNAGTGNFVFSGPDNRTLYLGWIAHGVDGMEPGDTIALPTVGVEATVVYCSWGIIEETVTCPELDPTHPRRRNDFALLRLPAEARSLVHPAVPVHGGPTELGAPPAASDLVHAIGNTPLRDGGRPGITAQDAMQGVVANAEASFFEAHLAPQPIPGDSGGPVLAADGAALGQLHSIGLMIRGSPTDPGSMPPPGTTIVSGLGYALDVMENETALDVELKTWPTFATPRAEDLADPPASP